MHAFDLYAHTENTGQELMRNPTLSIYTDKKEKKIFLIYKEIQGGAVAKS
jgi:hypothetical protein